MKLTVELTPDEYEALRYLSLQLRKRYVEDTVAPKLVTPAMTAMGAIYRAITQDEAEEDETP